MADLLKIEQVINRNLSNMFNVLMALCNTDVKYQIKACPKFEDMVKKLDCMVLIKAIKNTLYTGGSDNLHTRHKKAMVNINFWGL